MSVSYGTRTLAVDGDVSLHIHTWEPVDGPIRGRLLILHGMAEHGGRYGGLATFLAEQKMLVWAMDHRQHGLSINHHSLGRFKRSDTVESMLEDVDQVREVFDRNYGDIPLMMLGHSMGSLLARAYLQAYEQTCRAVVIMGSPVSPKALVELGKITSGLVAFVHGSHPSNFLHNLMIGPYNQKIERPKTPFDWLSKDHDQVADYAIDPLSGFIYNAYFYHQLARLASLTNKTKAMAHYPSTPTLLISGEEDPCGMNGKGVRLLYERYTALGKNIDMHLMKGMRHEIHNEVNNRVTYKKIHEFLAKTLQI